MTQVKTRVPCACGLAITVGQQARHERGRWHQVAAEARRLRALDLSFADIGRQLGLTRAYVRQRFHQLEKK